MRYFIEFSYSGKAYHGWQIQPNAITVQQVLENALSQLLSSTIELVGAGRTDAGVHALKMFAHFDYNEDFDLEKLIFRLNSFLPKDIAVYNIYSVNKDAHARFDATSRTYIYRISTQKNAFTFEGCYYLKADLNIEKMQQAANKLFNYKNFKCFSRSNTDVKTYNCVIKEAKWTTESKELIFTISADRFLRNMVRAIVGTLIDIGSGKLNVDDFDAIITSENRVNAGASAPAYGLYLSKIEYPKTIFI